MMLTQKTRAAIRTLLDAVTLTSGDGGEPAIIYLETDQPAVEISRAEFRRAAGVYGSALVQFGIVPGDLVIIAHTQNLESIYAFWGAILIGAVPSMFPTLTPKLDPDIYMNSIAELVRLSAVRAILTTDEFAAQLQNHVACPVYGSGYLAASIQADGLPAIAFREAQPETVAFLQHSSGTTGLQKGVALSHEAVLNQIASYSEAIELDNDDVIVSWLPLYHDMGLIAGFVLPLVQGRPLVLMSPFDWVSHPALLLRAIDAYQGTLCWLPNFAYNHCARRIRRHDSQSLSLASMRLFINCSEPVHHESHQMFLERFAAQGVKPEMLAVSYAMAENTFAVTQTPAGSTPNLDRVDGRALAEELLARPAGDAVQGSLVKVSCGRPIPGTEVQIVRQTGETLPERHVGEVAIRSNCMLSGYYRRPDLQPFQDGWYLTGDKGYVADGEVYIVGRSKDLIINAGKNIYPQDIEAIVNQVSGVRPGRAVVFGVADEKEGTELVAVVAEVKTADPAERQIIARDIRQEVVRQSLVTVSYVHLVDSRWLIKTSSGKIARGANRDKWLAEREGLILARLT
jgi:fatty-acyl-CoA synthase